MASMLDVMVQELTYGRGDPERTAIRTLIQELLKLTSVADTMASVAEHRATLLYKGREGGEGAD